MSSSPLVSFVWISFGWLSIIFCSFCSCSLVLHLDNMSFYDIFYQVLIMHKPLIKPSHITQAYQIISKTYCCRTQKHVNP